MELGGTVAMTGELMASEENVISWRGAVDPVIGRFVGPGATGSLTLEDHDGHPVAGAERLPVVYRRPGWYDATIPETAEIEPGETYTLEFKLMAPTETARCVRWKATTMGPVEQPTQPKHVGADSEMP